MLYKLKLTLNVVLIMSWTEEKVNKLKELWGKGKTASQIAEINQTNLLGIITTEGGVTDHSSIIAKALGVPYILGVKNVVNIVRNGDKIILDSKNKCIHINPEKEISQKFEKEILKFEEIDKKTSYDDNSIMFIGSSSIRLWDKLEDVMEPLNIIKRGYGGAHYRDLIFFIDRILISTIL